MGKKSCRSTPIVDNAHSAVLEQVEGIYRAEHLGNPLKEVDPNDDLVMGQQCG
ncbi:hypothetical protein D3C85_1299210 [compost metagenome]